MRRQERAARASAKAAQRIAELAAGGDLATCATVAWQVCGFCGRMGATALERRWRALCEELDGPGYATGERWRSEVRSVQAASDRELAALRGARAQIPRRIPCGDDDRRFWAVTP